MLNTWNGDMIAAHHANTQASAMAVNAQGDLVVLGSRRNLTLLELSDPQKVVRRIHLTNKWDISHLLWNPSLEQSNYLLTTYNQWADVWTFTESSGKCIAQLEGHTRAISDADWSVVEPRLCATCSLDTYIHVWDTRELKKQKLAISTVSGASQVKWNKVNAYCISTAHDGNIRVWDIRNTKTATHYITAHLSKINCLDWDPNNEHLLTSGGNDTSIRCWNMSETPRTPQAQTNLKFPVWKISYTPFGSGLVSVEYANFRETPMSLRNVNNLSQSIHNFAEHSDVVLGYRISKSKSDPTWKLVTWSKDQMLRVCKLDYDLLVECGMSKDDMPAFELEPMQARTFTNETFLQETNHHPVETKTVQMSSSSLESNVSLISDNLIADSADYNDGFSELHFAESSLTPKAPFMTDASMQSLEQEFKLLNTYLPNLYMDEIKPFQRYCAVTLRTPLHFVTLKISFPRNYPHNEPPVFVFTNVSNVKQEQVEKLKATLHESAQHHVKNNRSCLEPCLRQLTAQFSAMTYDDEEDQVDAFDPPPLSFAHTLRQHQLLAVPTNVPFPRTSGARFCGVGYLVIFLRPAHVRGYLSSNEKTPRSYASLTIHRNSTPAMVFPPYRNNSSNQLSTSQYSTSPNTLDVSLHSFYYKEKRSSRKLKHFSNMTYFTKEYEPPATQSPTNSIDAKLSKSQQYAGRVSVVDLTRILPVSRPLAEHYIIPDKLNFVEACLHNKQQAMEEEMDDLVQLWSCVSLLPESEGNPLNTDLVAPFAATPMGKTFLSQLMDHYCQQNDVQTLATLASTFACRQPHLAVVEKHERKSLGGDMKRSASYDTFRSTDPSKSSKDRDLQDWSSRIYNILSRSPPTGPSFMEHASRSNASSPIREQHVISSSDERKRRPLNLGRKKSKNAAAVQESMVDPSRALQMDAFKHSYSDLLERWMLDVKAAEIKKHMNGRKQGKKPEFRCRCRECGAKCGASCPIKGKSLPVCSVCQLPVKKLFASCRLCSHGGHRNHMQSWFKGQRSCPVCDCICAAS